MHFETVVDGRPYYNSTQTTTVDHQFVHRTSHPGGGSHHVVVTSTSSSGLKAKAFFLSRSDFFLAKIPFFPKPQVDSNKKSTQFLTPFSGPAFHDLSNGVIGFARRPFSDRSKFSIVASQKLPSIWFDSKQNGSHHMVKGHKKLPENGVRNCVHFCLRSHLT